MSDIVSTKHRTRKETISLYGYTAIQALLIVILGIFIYGHFFKAALEGVTLNPVDNYISQYAVSSSKGGHFRVVISSFGVVLFFLAYCLLRRLPMSLVGRIGPLLLAVSAATMIFVAVYPTRPVKQQEDKLNPWERLISAFSPPKNTTAESMNEAIAAVHDTMIEVSSVALLAAILFIAAAARYASPAGDYRIFVWGSVGCAALAFLLSLPLPFFPNWIPGLWQRASFFVLYLWVFGTVTFFKSQLGTITESPVS